MKDRLPLPALEYHLAHGCNLSCQQCSHSSNHHLAGAMPTGEQADADYSLWSNRLRPKRFALLGGEPLLNCGDPPIVNGNEGRSYIGYFENDHGEQWIFNRVLTRASRLGRGFCYQ